MARRSLVNIRKDRNQERWGVGPIAGSLILIAVVAAAALSFHIQKVENTRTAAEAFVEDRRTTAANIRLLSAHEANNLRTNPNRDHVTRARALGVEGPRTRDDATRLTSITDGPLHHIQTDDRVRISNRMRYGVPYVTHDTYRTLVLIAERFQHQLLELNLPPHRIFVTSTLRTQEDQSRLRRVNANAARGTSAHEFGTTVDVHYERYDYVASRDSFDVPDDVYEWLFREIVEREMATFSASYHRQFRALLGRVMRNMYEEDKLLVTMERNQPVFHFTINGELPEQRLAELLPADQLTPVSPG